MWANHSQLELKLSWGCDNYLFKLQQSQLQNDSASFKWLLMYNIKATDWTSKWIYASLWRNLFYILYIYTQTNIWATQQNVQ